MLFSNATLPFWMFFFYQKNLKIKVAYKTLPIGFNQFLFYVQGFAYLMKFDSKTCSNYVLLFFRIILWCFWYLYIINLFRIFLYIITVVQKAHFCLSQIFILKLFRFPNVFKEIAKCRKGLFKFSKLFGNLKILIQIIY